MKGRGRDANRPFCFFRHLGNGLTRMPWEHEILGSNPRCLTNFRLYLFFDN